jgi:hypothetical protein
MDMEPKNPIPDVLEVNLGATEANNKPVALSAASSQAVSRIAQSVMAEAAAEDPVGTWGKIVWGRVITKEEPIKK